MDKKSLFGIIGCGLLIGAAIYCVNKSGNKDSVNKYDGALLNAKDSMGVSPEHITEDNVVDLDVIKLQSANSIYDRHKTAVQVAKESMEKINKNVHLQSNKEEEFSRMLEELDMLSEER